MRMCSSFVWRICGLAALVLMAGGVAQAQPWIVDQEQGQYPTFVAAFYQTDLAQSFMQAADNINGADVKLYPMGSEADITIDLYDALPTQGGSLIASGTDYGVLPGEWAECRWSVVSITPETTYYLVFTSTDPMTGLGGDWSNPYPRGHVFANSGYQPYADLDYAFRTYRIPEPATLSLLALGGLALLRRR